MDRRIVMRVCLLTLLPSLLAGQSRTTAGLLGSVRTSGGEPISAATVLLHQLETGLERSTVTNADGRFLISLLPPGGPYRIEVEALGFATETRSDLHLQVGDRLALTFVLVEDALEVEGLTVSVDPADVINPSQVGLVTHIDEDQLEALPLISRNVMDLAALSPLVRRTETGGFSVAGQNERYNSILVDGVWNKDVFGLTAGGVPGGQSGARLIPMDAVQQYEVLVAPFDVRLSGFTGGILNAVTRSGTNEWRIRAGVVHRNESLIGGLRLPTGTVESGGVDRSLYAFSLGGPVVRDRAHFFVSAELEERTRPPQGFSLGRGDPVVTRIAPDTLARFVGLFRDRFGFSPGDAGPVEIGSRLSNVFGRLDWTLGQRHRLTVRNVFAGAEQDGEPNRSQYRAYGLDTNGNLRESWSNTSSAQLFSDFGVWGANEMTLTVQQSKDETTPVSDFPQVGVDLLSSVGGGSFVREVRGGSDVFAQENSLRQTTVRLTNSLSILSDSTTYTFGLTGAYYNIDREFLPARDGLWHYESLRAFEMDQPDRYERTVLLPGGSSAAEFDVLEVGAFGQAELEATERVTVRLGLRADAPFVQASGITNPDVLDIFEIDTGQVPSGQVLFSPRFGFNVQTGTERRGQIRGGFGLFTGQIPFVWLAEALHYDGRNSGLLVCRGPRETPGYTPEAPPQACLDGSDSLVQPIPQELRVSAAWDQELSAYTTLSLGFILTHALHQLRLEDANRGSPCRDGDAFKLDGYGGFERPTFGCLESGGMVPNVRTSREPYQSVLLATNESRDWAYTASVELRGTLTDYTRYQVGYSYGRSFDAMSLVFNDMASNYGLNPVWQDPTIALVRASNFDRPHKLSVSIFGSPVPGLRGLDISLLYSGQSGVPFSYVYGSDLNGDGFPGPGSAFERFNDLLYVPEDVGELPTTSLGSTIAFGSAVRTQECLNRSRGDYVDRNQCRTPWQHRLDLRLSQEFTFGGTSLRLEGDIVNVLNLMNPEWGSIRTVRSQVPLLELSRGERDPFQVYEIAATWTGGLLPGRDADGDLVPIAPWTARTPESQWQIQLGVRVGFGHTR